MELIYTDHNQIEQGVIKDFTLDLAYGKDENDFELITNENVLVQGNYFFIPDTEYGGIVDEIEATTNQGTVTYRGRSFQGILESFNMLEIDAFYGLVIDNDNIVVDALPSEILSGIIDQLQLPFEVVVDDEEQISITVERNQGVYSFLRSVCEPNNYKIKFDGFSITITGAIDYSSEDYYDTSLYNVKVKNSSKKPNHLIGVYKRDGENTIVKHLYFDEEGIVQPYYQLDSMHSGEPRHDYEYERIQDEKLITGIDEVVEVIEGGNTIETMDLVTELTDTDGNTPFVDGKPYDWDEKCYTDYFLISGVGDDGIQYSNPEIENEYEEFTIHDTGTDEYSWAWWQNHWNECYKRSGESPDYVYTQLSEDDCTHVPDVQPYNYVSQSEWNKNYSLYSYRVSQNEYANFEGIPQYAYEKQTKWGTYWNTNRGDYYIYVYKKKLKVVPYIAGKKGKEGWFYDSLKNYKIDGVHTFYDAYGNVKTTFSKPKGSKYTSTKYKIYKPVTYWEGWMSLNDYCSYKKKKLSDIKWESGKYYLKYEKSKKAPEYPPSFPIYKVSEMISAVPPAVSGSTRIKYYYPKDLVKPPYEQGLYYRKVKDNYGELCKAMLSKYDEIVNGLNVIEPQIDLELAELDVGDIIGSTHPFTNEQLTAKIGKKIVKGNSFGLIVSYEIG